MILFSEYCVYLIRYEGDKHPPLYIGSTRTINITEKGYLGSPRSKQWSDIVKKEQKLNPHLYSVDILSTHQTREEALLREYDEQVSRDVVKSEDYYNMSLACVNGFFGMDVTGDKNPRFGKPVSEVTREKIAKANKGNCVVSLNGYDWFTVPVDEYRDNKAMYQTPKGEFNHIVAEKTRERVRNKTHHFCNPDVQKAIHEKRRGMKLTEEQKQKISKARVDKNTPFWLSSLHQVKDNRWSYIDEIYSIYTNHVDLSKKNWKQDIVGNILNVLECIPKYWCSKLVVRFKEGWNPITDIKFREVVLDESCKN